MESRAHGKRDRTKEKERPARKLIKPARSVKKRHTPSDSAFARRAISLVKLVGIRLRLQEHNNHLQGLYAELGKIVYEQQMHRRARAGCIRSTGIEGLVDKIMEMRKKMDRMEREAGRLKNVV